MATIADSFGEFFRTAGDLARRARIDEHSDPEPPVSCLQSRCPRHYQRRLAGDPTVANAILDGPKSLAINVPAGAGKTAEGRE